MKTKGISRSKKILIADTSDNCNTILQYILLNDYGIDERNIAILKNGDDVLQATKKELFDLIIINNKLEGIDGLKVAEIIRQNREENLPQILGYLSIKPENLNDFDDFILKPSDLNTMSEKISKLLKVSNDVNNEIVDEIYS